MSLRSTLKLPFDQLVDALEIFLGSDLQIKDCNFTMKKYRENATVLVLINHKAFEHSSCQVRLRIDAASETRASFVDEIGGMNYQMTDIVGADVGEILTELKQWLTVLERGLQWLFNVLLPKMTEAGFKAYKFNLNQLALSSGETTVWYSWQVCEFTEKQDGQKFTVEIDGWRGTITTVTSARSIEDLIELLDNKTPVDGYFLDRLSRESIESANGLAWETIVGKALFMLMEEGVVRHYKDPTKSQDIAGNDFFFGLVGSPTIISLNLKLSRAPHRLAESKRKLMMFLVGTDVLDRKDLARRHSHRDIAQTAIVLSELAIKKMSNHRTNFEFPVPIDTQVIRAGIKEAFEYRQVLHQFISYSASPSMDHSCVIVRMTSPLFSVGHCSVRLRLDQNNSGHTTSFCRLSKHPFDFTDITGPDMNVLVSQFVDRLHDMERMFLWITNNVIPLLMDSGAELSHFTMGGFCIKIGERMISLVIQTRRKRRAKIAPPQINVVRVSKNDRILIQQNPKNLFFDNADSVHVAEECILNVTRRLAFEKLFEEALARLTQRGQIYDWRRTTLGEEFGITHEIRLMNGELVGFAFALYAEGMQVKKAEFFEGRFAHFILGSADKILSHLEGSSLDKETIVAAFCAELRTRLGNLV